MVELSDDWCLWLTLGEETTFYSFTSSICYRFTWGKSCPNSRWVLSRIEAKFLLVPLLYLPFFAMSDIFCTVLTRCCYLLGLFDYLCQVFEGSTAKLIDFEMRPFRMASMIACSSERISCSVDQLSKGVQILSVWHLHWWLNSWQLMNWGHLRLVWRHYSQVWRCWSWWFHLPKHSLIETYRILPLCLGS